MITLNIAKSYTIEVTNTLTNKKIIYPSLRQAAVKLGVSRNTIVRHLKSKEVYLSYKFRRIEG